MRIPDLFRAPALAAVMLLGLRCAALAEPPPPLVIRIGSSTPKTSTIYLVRGGAIVFEGSFLPGTLVGKVIAQCGERDVEADLDDNLHFTLNWTPPANRSIASVVLSGKTRDARTDELEKRFNVYILDAEPFAISGGLSRSLQADTALITLTSTGALKAQEYEALIDDRPANAIWSQDHASASVDLTGAKAGAHGIRLRVTMGDGGQYLTQPTTIGLAPKVSLDPLTIDKVDPTIPEEMPDVPLTAKTDADLTAGSVEFTVDDRPVKGLTDVPLKDGAATAQLDPRGLSEGKHGIGVEVRVHGKVRYRSADQLFTVLVNRKEVLRRMVRHYNELIADAGATDDNADIYRRASIVADKIMNDPLFDDLFFVVTRDALDNGSVITIKNFQAKSGK